MHQHPAIQLFEELLIPAPSGSEQGVAEIIRNKLSSMGFPHETDPAGNVLVRLAGYDPNAALFIFAAHMDEIGMVVTRIEANGDLGITRSGGLYPWKLGEGPVEILGDKKAQTDMDDFSVQIYQYFTNKFSTGQIKLEYRNAAEW